ncbi:glutamate racemase [Parapedobacter indicus]|uniref:Glutamate racemase n=1 Tax=Parapedobacter indicus TaxID=1477437 RepID=A0A1I3DEE6_9SPHI|nr:glutamate racemase [Parapedobacter indicus]PPL04630.1 glutamate racemase [Parapedobacter indicus]SFH84851.1 glutamate racemase [Parapedobacter indicus]
MGPIGIFDSGYGGLTVFREIVAKLPEYDYVYLGDNARVPYGTRSFETVYAYTKECVEKLFAMDCHLVVLACNTASAKALRTIQQQDLPLHSDLRKVLGVIRPTTEVIGNYTRTRHIGILATPGTVRSASYPIEIHKFFPDITVYQQACPLWVPLVENNELDSEGTAYFVESDIKRLLQQSPDIDTVILACTHYPLLLPLIKRFMPPHIEVLPQGKLVANSLADYLVKHREVETLCTKNGHIQFFTTDNAVDFEEKTRRFYGQAVKAQELNVC